jgi:hypothetical protein
MKDRAPAQSKHPLRLQRGWERSRLEADVLAATYELLVPLLRQPAPADKQRIVTDANLVPPSRPSKGASA